MSQQLNNSTPPPIGINVNNNSKSKTPQPVSTNNINRTSKHQNTPLPQRSSKRLSKQASPQDIIDSYNQENNKNIYSIHEENDQNRYILLFFCVFLDFISLYIP